MKTFVPMPSVKGAAVAVLAASLLLVGGCSHQSNPVSVGSAQPVPTSIATAPSSATPAMTATPSAGSSPNELSPGELKPPQLTNVQVVPQGNGFEVRGTLLTADGKPIIGAVGDFYLEGAQANLIQSYATDVNGSFHSRFTNSEAPAWADLMLHFRGDSNNAPNSFVVRKATESRPATSSAPSAPAPSPSVGKSNVPAPAAPSTTAPVPTASSAPVRTTAASATPAAR